jgi:hypothetical protein
MEVNIRLHMGHVLQILAPALYLSFINEATLFLNKIEETVP